MSTIQSSKDVEKFLSEMESEVRYVKFRHTRILTFSEWKLVTFRDDLNMQTWTTNIFFASKMWIFSHVSESFKTLKFIFSDFDATMNKEQRLLPIEVLNIVDMQQWMTQSNSAFLLLRLHTHFWAKCYKQTPCKVRKCHHKMQICIWWAFWSRLTCLIHSITINNLLIYRSSQYSGWKNQGISRHEIFLR